MVETDARHDSTAMLHPQSMVERAARPVRSGWRRLLDGRSRVAVKPIAFHLRQATDEGKQKSEGNAKTLAKAAPQSTERGSGNMVGKHGRSPSFYLSYSGLNELPSHPPLQISASDAYISDKCPYWKNTCLYAHVSNILRNRPATVFDLGICL